MYYNLTLSQVDAIINQAAADNRLWHYNGGQAYIALSPVTLMIVDHTTANVSVDIRDGEKYFDACRGANLEYSRNMRERPSELAFIHALV